MIRARIARGLSGRALDYIYLLDWTVRVERADLQPIRTEILNSLARHNPAQLRSFLDVGRPASRLFYYQFLLTSPDAQPDLVDKALRDPAVKVRHWALRLIATVNSEHWARWSDALLNDEAPGLRAIAVRTFAETRWQDVEGKLTPMIFDRSRSVREAVWYYLAKHGRIDFAQAYRSRRNEPDPIRIVCIAGLAEVGAESDYELLTPFLGDVNPRVRAAALGASARLNFERATPSLIDGLSDPSGKVRRIAVGALVNARIPIRERLLPIFERGTPRGQTAAFAVLTQLGGWESLRDILHAIAKGSGPLVNRGWIQLELWHRADRNRLFTRPTRQIAAEINEFSAMIDAQERSDEEPRPHRGTRKSFWDEAKELLRAKMS